MFRKVYASTSFGERSYHWTNGSFLWLFLNCIQDAQTFYNEYLQVYKDIAFYIYISFNPLYYDFLFLWQKLKTIESKTNSVL